MREIRAEITFVHSSEYEENISNRKLFASYSTRKVSIEKTEKPNYSYQGYSAIKEAVKELRFWINHTKVDNSSDKLISIYNTKIHQTHESTLSPYFRIIYTILNRLRTDQVLSASEKTEFGNLLRSQLTSDEVCLIAVNGLTPVSKDLDKLITEFRMLKYLPKTSLKKELEIHYEEITFQSRD